MMCLLFFPAAPPLLLKSLPRITPQESISMLTRLDHGISLSLKKLTSNFSNLKEGQNQVVRQTGRQIRKGAGKNLKSVNRVVNGRAELGLGKRWKVWW
ncbi:hypothetical protein EYF80_051752 [Liparis tanakae]|uniref:Uncharacterized protein n=1 Tax=Liparis tanakae TaxID=230148 RepID=A0A4Z2FB95_9TELE|nr:hypothetical protein EYF80_051752 [Liparis tanakae]